MLLFSYFHLIVLTFILWLLHNLTAFWNICMTIYCHAEQISMVWLTHKSIWAFSPICRTGHGNSYFLSYYTMEVLVAIWYQLHFMPLTWEKWRGHISSRLSLCVCVCVCIHASGCHECCILVTMHDGVLKFHVMDSSSKISRPCVFFLSELSPFIEFCPFAENRIEDISKKGYKLGIRNT